MGDAVMAINAGHAARRQRLVGAGGRRVGSNNGRLSIMLRNGESAGCGVEKLRACKSWVCEATQADRWAGTSGGSVAK